MPRLINEVPIQAAVPGSDVPASALAGPIDVPVEEIEAMQGLVPDDASQGQPEASASKPTEVFDELPKDVAALPAIKMISIGQPPAFSIGPGELYMSLLPLVKNIDKVFEAGLDIMQTPSGESVVYNPMLIDKEEIAMAAQTGKLASVIPNYGSLTGESPVSDSKSVDKILAEVQKMPSKLQRLQEQDEEPASATPPGAPLGGPPPPAMSIPPPPPATQNMINRQRLQGLTAGSPTSGPKPGGGRVLSALLQRPV